MWSVSISGDLFLGFLEFVLFVLRFGIGGSLSIPIFPKRALASPLIAHVKEVSVL